MSAVFFDQILKGGWRTIYWLWRPNRKRERASNPRALVPRLETHLGSGILPLMDGCGL